MRSLALLAMLFSIAPGQATVQNDPCPQGPHTLYSQRAISLDSGSEKIKSPDGKKLLTVSISHAPEDAEEPEMVFTVTIAKRAYSARLPGFDAEVLWSPDSSAFAVNETEGGGGIGVRVYVFYVSEAGLKKVVVSGAIEKVFGTPVKCEVPVPPNTAFVDWLGGRADRLLVAAEVVPVSICECSGMFKLYEVTLPNLRIVNTYKQAEGVRKFRALLGCELRDPNAGCAERRGN